MADKGGAKGGAGEEGKEGEDKEPEKGCCDKYAECLVVTGKAVYSCCLAICTCIRECLAFIWYPCKERCCGCLDNCDKHYNQWKDEGFTDV
ncbi:unnamed protein product (macronuclear) [Paramecium tetraurelia]|uniref:Cysteine-rich transmembrane CYSTM domain-containing protein n=1 Tax=Paramecium tetraurelia TaxID=5888 RepID=A0BAK4_PARTE|nr:uncharacterized protein GSPATT00000006001 [Paramecium tetraurelia]CAK55571.1 unnamed protein product [Paramecium tetraurelia]|eukprot:XP_001422969.1 hypothetical protein (macronuclear) [Paramecium tetraurelia strain d4-2]